MAEVQEAFDTVQARKDRAMENTKAQITEELKAEATAALYYRLSVVAAKLLEGLNRRYVHCMLIRMLSFWRGEMLYERKLEAGGKGMLEQG